jgi:hypothetical protein
MRQKASADPDRRATAAERVATDFMVDEVDRSSVCDRCRGGVSYIVCVRDLVKVTAICACRFHRLG